MFLDWSSSGLGLVARSQTTAINATEAIWRNPLTNETRWTRMQGSRIVEQQLIDASRAPQWRIASTGDFNRDGHQDILWRHDTGRLEWALLKQGNVVGNVQLIDIPDQNWQVVGIGDVDRDGNSDILWRNYETGRNSWWKLPQLTPAVNQTIVLDQIEVQDIMQIADTSWIAAGTGDVNRDGHTDVLWHNSLRQRIAWWRMSGSEIIGINDIDRNLDPGQTIGQIADFHQDGALDFIVENAASGTSDLWKMSFPQQAGIIASTVTPIDKTSLGNPIGASWQVVGATIVGADAGNTLTGAVLEASPIFSRRQTIGGPNDGHDLYRFDIGTSGVFAARLAGLTADADIRLINDRNGNGTIDQGEVLAWQWERGSQAESIQRFITAGRYFLEVRSYDSQVTNYQVTTRFTAAATDPNRIDIQIQLPPANEPIDSVTLGAIESAAAFWEDVLIGGGDLLAGSTLPIQVVNADLAQPDGSPDTLTLAFAGPNVVSDGQRLLLRSGTVTLNRQRQGGQDPNSIRDLFIHEFAHVLGFGTLWEPLTFRLRDGSLKQIGAAASSLVDRTSRTYRANSYAGWAYGELLATKSGAKLQQTAVPLEANSFAHWDESRFQTESLTPIANVGAQPLSQLTLASLRDIGWQVNFGAAQDYVLPDDTASSSNFANRSTGLIARSIQATTADRANNQPHHNRPAHPSNCGCAAHLMGHRPNLMTMVGITAS